MEERPPKYWVVVYIKVENEDIVEGRFPTTGPLARVRVDKIVTQDVPPRPFVRRTLPELRFSPVLES